MEEDAASTETPEVQIAPARIVRRRGLPLLVLLVLLVLLLLAALLGVGCKGVRQGV